MGGWGESKPEVILFMDVATMKPAEVGYGSAVDCLPSMRKFYLQSQTLQKQMNKKTKKKPN